MKNMAEITFDSVQAIMLHKGYQIFTDGRPNIIGIRSAIKDSNRFDDTCFVWWHDGDQVIRHQYTITTHPGYFYLQNPIKGNGGTAILVPGQYINIWGLGMHRQKQFALVQVYGKVKVYRDNDKDTSLDYDPATIQEGFFGINGHHASLTDVDFVGQHSAGCQVWRYHQPHIDLMQDFKGLSEKYKFKRFSYTLLMQEDFA